MQFAEAKASSSHPNADDSPGAEGLRTTLPANLCPTPASSSNANSTLEEV